jgi:ABC-type sugar transport system substrate-binding protein
VRARNQRSLVAMLMAAAALTALGAVGGIGAVGGGSVASAQYQYGKVTICHVAGKSGQRVTITVAASAVPAHLDHGDTVGPCR